MKRSITHVINSSNANHVATGVTTSAEVASVQEVSKSAKRRFQPPASINVSRLAAKASSQPVQTASASKATGGNGNGSPAVAAQYYSVLYTKRAANKVCCCFTRLQYSFSSHRLPHISAFSAEEEKQVIPGWRLGSEGSQRMYSV